MVYKLRAMRSEYLNAYISPDEIEDKLGDYFLLDNPIWADFWKPVEVSFQDDSDNKNVSTLPDITLWYTSNNLILNQKAHNAALSAYGEFLPILYKQTQYWLFHTTKKTDMEAVDQSNSERHIDEGGFVNLDKLAFRESAIKDLLIFQSEYSNYRNLYCTPDFKDMVETAGLNGLVFSKNLVSII